MKAICLLFLLAGSIYIQGFSQSLSMESNQPITNKFPPRKSGTFLYTLTSFHEPYTALSEATSLNNGEVWDDPEYFMPLEHPFDLNGNLIVYLQFSGAGALLQSQTAGLDYTYLIPFETDLIDRGASKGVSMSPISYKMDGEPGSRIFKIEMKNAGSKHEFVQSGTTDMFINLQVWLYEYQDIVEFRYGENAITDPAIFYSNAGAVVGITDYDPIDSIYINPHFLAGPSIDPELSISSAPLDGTPVEGTVYRLAPLLPISVLVSGTNSTSYCAPNGSATAIASEGVPPYTYLWNTGDTTATITGLDSDIYVVTVTDQSGDTKARGVIISNVNPINPIVTSTTETGTDVNDGTATSSPLGGDPPYAFAWSNGDTTETIINLNPSIYTVTVTDNQGCTGTESVIVNHFGCDDIHVDVYTSMASCAGFCDATIEVQTHGGIPPYVYTISEGGGSEGLCAGTYYITITDSDGCGLISDLILISENDPLDLIAGSIKETAPFANDGVAWVTPIQGVPPFLFSWSNGEQDSLVTNLTPGTYTVTVTDANGCIESISINVEEFGCGGYTESFIYREYCLDTCSWRINTLLVDGVGPFDYQWSTGDTSYRIENLCPGMYSLTVVDKGYGDCTYDANFTILPNENVAVTVDEVMHFTNTHAGSISISVTEGSPPYSYYWSSPGQFTSFDEDISNLSPGFYHVEVQSRWGCIRIDSIEIKDFTVNTTHQINQDARIYPNPATDQLHIEMKNIGESEIQLISLDGRPIRAWEGQSILDVCGVPEGNYLVEVRTNSGVIRRQITLLR